MPLPDVRTNHQRLSDAAQDQHVQMWRAAQAVRARTPEGTGREELLDCLGLSDVQRPLAREEQARTAG